MTTAQLSPVAIWLRGMRAPFFSASIVPVLVGGAAAFASTGRFQWGLFLVTLLGLVSFHAAANILNDYLDYRSGCDPNNQARTIFNGGSNVIADGLLSETAMRTGAIVAYAVGSACGLALVFAMGPLGWVVLVLGLVGMAISYTYTIPRVFLAGRGLGEVGVALCFGLLAVTGTAFVQMGRFSWTALFASFPVAGLIVAILWINQFPDVAADRAVGKDNLVVRLGKARARYGYHALIAFSYLSVVGGVALRQLSPWALLCLLPLPLALRAARILHTRYEETTALVPAQGATIQAHMLTGVLLAVGLLVAGLVS